MSQESSGELRGWQVLEAKDCKDIERFFAMLLLDTGDHDLDGSSQQLAHSEGAAAGSAR